MNEDFRINDYPASCNKIVVCVPSFKGGSFQYFILRRKLINLGLHVVTLDFSFRWFAKKNFQEMSLSKGKKELESILYIIKNKYPNKKIILFSQSFGGVVSLSVDKRFVDGIALSSPVLEIKETLSSYFGDVSLSDLMKKEYMYFFMPVYSPIKPLYFKVKTSVIDDIVSNFDHLKVAKGINHPLLVFYGHRDERVSRKTIDGFIDAVPATEKQLIVLDGGHSAPPLLFTSLLAEKINSFIC
ncbi:MAG: alpha/beta hydrolase [bacterium]